MSEFRLYINYMEYHTGGEPIGDGPWCDHEPEYIDLSINGIYRDPGNRMFYDSLEVSEELFNAETVYLLTARYSTGDTFSSQSGKFEFCGFYPTYEAAEKAAEARGTAEWNDYFGGFDDWQIESFPVSNKMP